MYDFPVHVCAQSPLVHDKTSDSGAKPHHTYTCTWKTPHVPTTHRLSSKAGAPPHTQAELRACDRLTCVPPKFKLKS